MVLLIEIEAICQNVSSCSHCFMFDLEALFTGCIKTNVHISQEKKHSVKVSAGNFSVVQRAF